MLKRDIGRCGFSVLALAIPNAGKPVRRKWPSSTGLSDVMMSRASPIVPRYISIILNPIDRVWVPCLGYGVDSIGKRGRVEGINGFWSRHVGETRPRTMATPTVVGTNPREDDLAVLGPDIVIWIWYKAKRPLLNVEGGRFVWRGDDREEEPSLAGSFGSYCTSYCTHSRGSASSELCNHQTTTAESASKQPVCRRPSSVTLQSRNGTSQRRFGFHGASLGLLRLY